MFIIDLTYKVDLTDVDPHMSGHMAFLNKYYEQGVFIMSGRKKPRTGGIILAKAESRDTLEAIVNEDPFVKADLVNCVITEFAPSKVGTALDPIAEFIGISNKT